LKRLFGWAAKMAALRPRETQAMLLSPHDNQEESGKEILLDQEIAFFQEVLRRKGKLSVLAGL
jgi:hypothetical protein